MCGVNIELRLTDVIQTLTWIHPNRTHAAMLQFQGLFDWNRVASLWTSRGVSANQTYTGNRVRCLVGNLSPVSGDRSLDTSIDWSPSLVVTPGMTSWTLTSWPGPPRYWLKVFYNFTNFFGLLVRNFLLILDLMIEKSIRLLDPHNWWYLKYGWLILPVDGNELPHTNPPTTCT